MKRIFKHLFMFTMLFVIPMFVLAEETTTFDHIDIDPTVSLKYTVLGNVETHSKTLDSSLAGLKIYELAQDGTTKVEPAISISNAEYINDSSVYRVNGEFKKYYDGSDKEVKYLVEYEFEVNVPGTTKSVTYSKEYSYSSEDDGILVSLTSEDSIKTFAPKLIINKTVKKLTPDGTFTFSVNGNNVTIKTEGATESTEGSGSEIVYLELNKSYTVNEINIPSTYKVESVSSDKGTVGNDNSVTFTTNGDIDYEIVVNYKNESKVDHSKDLVDNHDGTHQISLDVTGENEKGAVNRANVVVVLDISGSMDSETNKTISEIYSAVAPGDDNLYGIDNNGNYFALTRQIDYYSGNVYYTYGSGWNPPRYNGIFYKRTTKETRMIAARNAVNSLANSLLGNNTAENPDIVKMALVTFSTKATTAVNPTFTYSDIETAVNKAYAQGGTNWEDALSTARGINFGNDRNDATTYVIFISDGNPTYRNTTNDNYNELPLSDNVGWYSINGYGRIQEARVCNANGYCYYPYELYKNDDSYYDSDGVYGLGNDTQYKDDGRYNYNYSPTSMERCYDHAKDDARLIVNTDKSILYSIGAYGNVNRMQSLTNYAYTGSDTTAPQGNYYYSASDTDALNQALKDILDAIERSGIGAVTIDDGTTNKITVETSTGTEDYKLLTVDTTSYKYWLKFPVTVKNGKKYIYVNDTEVEVNNSATTLTWQGHDPLTITDSKFSDDGEYFIYSWKGANDFYNVAPPTAELVDGSVKWVLSKESVGVLLNGVTYSVTVNVWPSQFTYDLIADLNNGIKNYDDDLPDEVKEYFREVGGSYILSTNTTAKLTYDDSRDEEGPRTTNYVNPNPVNTDVSELSIEKEWYNGLDSRKASSIDIYLTRDTGIYKKYTLTSDNNWKTDVSISTGLISFDETTKTAIIREVGHDYSFKEGDDDAYYWDLVVDVFRPMIINDEVKMLVKVSGISFDGNYYYDEDNNKEYFKIEGNVYVVSDNSNSIIAKNYRRSNLNITKKVEGDFDPDTLFRFTLVVNDPKHNDVWFSILNGTDYVLNTNDTTYVSGATPEIIKASEHITGIVNNEDGSISYYEDGKLKTTSFIKEVDGSYYTGFYYATSGSTITVNMKAGWNLRFTNLPNNSTYTFNEILDAPLGNGKKLSDAFNFSKVELNVIKKDNNQNVISNTTPYESTDIIVSKLIEQYNTQYTVIYTNTPVTISKEVVKSWLEDNNDANHTRPGNITVYLYADKVLKDTVTISSTDNWKHTWSGLAKFNAQGKEIEYTVDEASVSNYLPVINGFNIVNYYNLRDIVVNKQWGDSAKTPEVEVKLSSDYDNFNDTKPLNTDNNWTHTWQNLPKYYLDDNKALQLIHYIIEEVKIAGKQVVNNVLIDFDDYIKSKIGKWTSVVSGDMNQGFTIINNYTKYDKNLSFKKMSFDDFNNNSTNGLSGARFRLYKYIGKYNGASNVSLDTDNPLVDSSNWIYVGEAISNSDGLMLFNDLYEGEYRLVEVQAPASYVKVDGQWRIFIDLDEVNDTVSIRNLANSNTYIGRATAVSMVGNDIVVLNEKVPEIPTTGGIGIPHYNKYGLLIVALSIVLFLMGLMNQKKQIENI